MEDCLASLFSTDYPNFELLFVDNGSTDHSVEYVNKKFGQTPQLRVVRNERNFGFAEGNNRGIKAAKGEYIALVNTDTRVDSAWLRELVEAIQSPDVGAVQSKLLMMHSPDLLDSGGGLLDYYGYHVERGRGEKAAVYNRTAEVFYAKGAGVLIKSKALQKTGLLDPDIFMYFDETDLCWRLRLCGFKMFYIPNSIVYHASGVTASILQERNRLFFHVRNHLLVLLKNYGLGNLVKAGAVSILLELRNLILFLVRGKPLVSLAIVQALFWNLRSLKVTWGKRRVVQEIIRVVPDSEVKKAMLKPYPPFPLYLVFSRFRYIKHKQKINT